MKRCILLLLCGFSFTLCAQQTKIILDADTGNEVDDLYAIVRALIEPGWEILALNAAQWQSSQWASAETMEESHRLNQVLVGYLKMENRVPTMRGGHRRMYDWGDLAQHSAAAYGIIREARRLPPGQKLTVVVLGALTNVASALYIDPEIESSLEVYWLGLNHDFGSGKTTRVDFNAIMDPRATHIMLESEVEMHIVPGNVAAAMEFNYVETAARFEGIHPLGDYLLDRWTQHLDGGRYSRTIWDLGLIGAMIHPEWATEIKAEGFENPNIWLYRDLDAPSIRDEFFNSTLKYLDQL
jgi:inosine-uridine nucleoside N-ribohydrolase